MSLHNTLDLGLMAENNMINILSVVIACLLVVGGTLAMAILLARMIQNRVQG